MTLSAKYWPAHLKPQIDEIFSSWLYRISKAHSLKPHTFCSIIWPSHQFWNRDIDKLVNKEVLRIISSKTNTSYQSAFTTTLRSYVCLLHNNFTPRTTSRGILDLGVYHRLRTLNGQQYCGYCLANDETPYFRKRWRIVYSVICLEHNSILLDSCPKCESAINFHRNSELDCPIYDCYYCGFDLRKSYHYQEKSNSIVIDIQKKINQAIEKGWLNIGNDIIYSHLYFEVVRQIMRLFMMRNISKNFKKKVLEECFRHKDSDCFSYTSNVVEKLGTDERYMLLGLSAWILDDWPDRFTKTCQIYNILSSDLFRDMKEIPYWYSKTVRKYCYEASYNTTDEEVESVIKHTIKNDLPMSELAISKLLGVSQVFRKRNKKLNDFLVCNI